MALFNEFAVANAVSPTVEQNMNFYDVWGTDQTYPHYAVGWALGYALQMDQASRLAISGARATGWPWPGPRTSRTPAASATSSTM